MVVSPLRSGLRQFRHCSQHLCAVLSRESLPEQQGGKELTHTDEKEFSRTHFFHRQYNYLSSTSFKIYFIELKSMFRNVLGYKVSIQKSVVFLHASNK